MTTLIEIEKASKVLAERREQLRLFVSSLQAGLEAVKKQHLPVIRKALTAAEEANADLMQLVEDNPELYEKPKSKTFHNIKSGYRKQPGEMVIADAKKTIAALENEYGLEYAEEWGFIETEIKLRKKGLETLEGKFLKKIGVTITNDTDVAFVKAVDTDLDKLVLAAVGGEAA
jgi:hypothetical protein